MFAPSCQRLALGANRTKPPRFSVLAFLIRGAGVGGFDRCSDCSKPYNTKPLTLWCFRYRPRSPFQPPQLIQERRLQRYSLRSMQKCALRLKRFCVGTDLTLIFTSYLLPLLLADVSAWRWEQVLTAYSQRCFFSVYDTSPLAGG